MLQFLPPIHPSIIQHVNLIVCFNCNKKNHGNKRILSDEMITHSEKKICASELRFWKQGGTHRIMFQRHRYSIHFVCETLA